MKIDNNKIEQALELEVQKAITKYGKDIEYTLLNIIGLVKLLTPAAPVQKEERIIPLSEWKNYHDYPTESALRQHYFYKDTNGFEECVEYGGNNGGRILLVESKVFEWIEKNKKKRKK